MSFRNTTTHCGVRFDIFKSGLQKCARRCEIENVQWFTHEIFALKHFCDPNLPFAKANHTNVINRLKTIAVEDVSPRCIDDFNVIFTSIKEWEKDGLKVASLARAIWLLFATKKLRVCSHLRILTHPSINNYVDKVDWRTLFRKSDIKPTEEYRSKVARAIGSHYRYVFGLTNSTPIDAGDLNDAVTLRGKKTGFELFWKTLKDLCWNSQNAIENLSYKQELFESRKHFKEELLCLISAAEAVIARVNEMDLAPLELTGVVEEEEKILDWTNNVYKPINFGMHVMDKHTRGGVGGTEFFVRVGATINNEDEEWALRETEKLYVQVRCCSYQPKRKSSQPTGDETFPKKRKTTPPRLMYALAIALSTSHIDFSDYNIVKNCTPNSRKGVTLILQLVKERRQRVICAKEMRKSCNFGVDQLAVFKAKRMNVLRLKGIHVPRPHPGELVTSRTLFNAKDGSSNIVTSEVERKLIVYFLSSCVGDGVQDVRFTHLKKEIKEGILHSEEIIQSLVSIIIFRTIFGVTDTNFSNVLVWDDKLYSVDENAVGKFSFSEVWNHKPVRLMVKMAVSSARRLGLENLTSFLPDWLESPETQTQIKSDIRELLEKFKLPSEGVLENFQSFYNFREKFRKVEEEDGGEPWVFSEKVDF